MEVRRVCLFCEKWESGGIESFLFNVLTHADLTGLEVDLVAAELCPSVFTAPLEKLGVRFIELSGRQRDMKANNRRFRELLTQRRYDVVHLNVFQGLALYYAKLAADAGVLVRIAHSHNTALRKSPTRALKLLLHRWGCRRYGRYATDCWACSADAARFLLEEREYRFVPNGIDTQRFRFDADVRRQVRGELGCGDKLVIGHVGRLCYQKNQSFLLDVFARLKPLRPDSLLLLVGTGEDLDTLKDKSVQLGVAEDVVFYGTTDKPERLYQAMDAFAFPSLFEGLGIAAVEAQAAGLPTFCSEHIPPEALVTALARRLPLEPERWLQALLEIKETSRTSGAQEVKTAGFEIAAIANWVMEGWKGHG